MLALAQRHDDRAKRKAANRADLNDGTAGSVATAETMLRDAMAARARLSEDQRAELDESIKLADDNGELETGTRSLAEAPDGSGDTMAGIGVVNVKVVPASILVEAEAGNGGGSNADAGWGSIQPITEAALEPIVLPEGSNANGAALAEQGAVDPKVAAKGAKTPKPAAE